MSVADDHSDEHHLPAVEDWPRGFGEASWWPFVTAVGAAGMYFAAALVALARGESALVGPTVGPAAFVAATVVFLGGLYGWLYHAFVSHFWNRAADEDGGIGLRWGMLLFLGTEIATFGAGFVYYFFIRVDAWPPGHLPHLLSSLIAINTLILVASSVTLHVAHLRIRDGNHASFVRWLALTVFLGLTFLGGQVIEYYEFLVVEGFGPESVFGSAFYGLTGLHGLHVTMGVVLLGIVLVRGMRGQFSADRHVAVSTTSMYWHFVDAVWLFLVAVIYVGGSVSL